MPIVVKAKTRAFLVAVCVASVLYFLQLSILDHPIEVADLHLILFLVLGVILIANCHEDITVANPIPYPKTGAAFFWVATITWVGACAAKNIYSINQAPIGPLVIGLYFNATLFSLLFGEEFSGSTFRLLLKDPRRVFLPYLFSEEDLKQESWRGNGKRGK